MKIRFQADSDFRNSAVLAIACRWPFIDIRSAQRLIPDAFPDPDILAFAASEGRVLLSHDVSTIPEHFRRFLELHDSPGIILVPQQRSIRSIMEVSIWHGPGGRRRICGIPYDGCQVDTEDAD